MRGPSTTKQKKLDAKRRKAKKRRKNRQVLMDRFESSRNVRERLREHERFARNYFAERGYQHTFLDYLDSYVDEYQRISKEVVAKHQSLLGVYECDDSDYRGMEDNELLAKFGHHDFRRLLYTLVDVAEEEYGRNQQKREMVCGRTMSLQDECGNLKTVIVMKKGAGRQAIPEFKCCMKLPALLHEVGHVDDWEKGVNFGAGEVSVVDTEAYAHTFSLERLMEGGYRLALQTYTSALSELRAGASHEREIAKRLLDTDLFLQCRELGERAQWWEHMNPDDMTKGELEEYYRLLGDGA